MNRLLTDSFNIWRSRKYHTMGERAYFIYLFVLLIATVLFPLGRMVWLSVNNEFGVAVFSSQHTPSIMVLFVLIIWVVALFLGRIRGPALLPPFLLYALAASSASRFSVFSRPLLQSTFALLGFGTSITAIIAHSLQVHGLANGDDAILFILSGVLLGILTTLVWLVGQSMPKTALLLGSTFSLFIFIISILIFLNVIPNVPFLVFFQNNKILFIGSLFIFNCILILFLPILLDNLELDRMLLQAQQWELVTTYTVSMNFSAVTLTYQTKPYWGRNFSAINSHSNLVSTIFIRGLLGSIRTPIRLTVGIITLSVSGLFVVAAHVFESTQFFFGILAGIIIFIGVNPLMDGVRYSISLAGDFSYLGLSNKRNVLYHVIFPASISAFFICIFSLVGSIIASVSIFDTVFSSFIMGLLIFSVKFVTLLKGPLPPALLTPTPTPVGDFSVVIQILWALDGIFFTIFFSVLVMKIYSYPLIIVISSGALAVIGMQRWKNR